MSCIVLVGGLIGCGKSNLVNFFRDNQNDLFKDSISNENDERMNEYEKLKQNRIYQIIIDELCTIKEQAELVGWGIYRTSGWLAMDRSVVNNGGR